MSARPGEDAAEQVERYADAARALSVELRDLARAADQVARVYDTAARGASKGAGRLRAPDRAHLDEVRAHVARVAAQEEALDLCALDAHTAAGGDA